MIVDTDRLSILICSDDIIRLSFCFISLNTGKQNKLFDDALPLFCSSGVSSLRGKQRQPPVGYKSEIEIDGTYRYDLWEGDSTCEQFQSFCDKNVPASCCSFCTYTEGEGGCILLKGAVGTDDLTPLCVCDNPDPTFMGWYLGTADLCPAGEQVVPECEAGLVSDVLPAKPSKYGGGYVSGAAVDSEDEDDYEDDALADGEAWSPPQTTNSPRGHVVSSAACMLGAVSVIAQAFV